MDWVDTETGTVYRGEAAREAQRQAQAAARKARAMELLDTLPPVCQALTELAVRLLGGPPADALARLVGRTGAVAILRGGGHDAPAHWVDEQRDQIGFERAPAAVPLSWSSDPAHDSRVLAALAGDDPGTEVPAALARVQADDRVPLTGRQQAERAALAISRGVPVLDALAGDHPGEPRPVPDAERRAQGMPFLPANAQGVPQQVSRPVPGGDADTSATWPDRQEMSTSV